MQKESENSRGESNTCTMIFTCYQLSRLFLFAALKILYHIEFGVFMSISHSLFGITTVMGLYASFRVYKSDGLAVEIW